MFSQENIYHLIVHGHWTAIINLLYKHKEDIASDPLLNHALKVFEQEFFKRLNEYPNGDTEIIKNIDKLYTLNYGNFYTLQEENYKKLVLELVKRKPLKEAHNYAQIFPNEDISKEIITLYNQSDTGTTTNQIMESVISYRTWIEVYNRLFELINKQGDDATYFSGPRFIDTVRKFMPYYPRYEQYIEERNKEGKSTSRKIYYFDILFELKESVRLQVVRRIVDIVKPFEVEKSSAIEELLGLSATNADATITVEDESIGSENDNKTVFISYSWDNDEHKKWVLDLAVRLQLNGIEVILDQYALRLGRNLPHFVEQSISRANRIIIIFTPNYKLKADNRTGGVGYEYSIMNAKLYQSQTKNDKIIPVLRAGIMAESIPDFMQQFIHLDMTKDENFENSYNDLIREILDQPAIQKPTLGKRPNFN